VKRLDENKTFWRDKAAAGCMALGSSISGRLDIKMLAHFCSDVY